MADGYVKLDGGYYYMSYVFGQVIYYLQVLKEDQYLRLKLTLINYFVNQEMARIHAVVSSIRMHVFDQE